MFSHHMGCGARLVGGDEIVDYGREGGGGVCGQCVRKGQPHQELLHILWSQSKHSFMVLTLTSNKCHFRTL